MPVYLRCVVCEKEFSVPPVRAATAKACSKECADKVRAASRQRRTTLTCEECKKPFDVPRAHADRRRFCSQDCKNANVTYRSEIASRVTGANNPVWRGGKTKHKDGYVYTTVGKEHPFSTSAGYMLEHRAVIEKWLRENNPESHYLVRLGERLYLSPEYDVHHKDEDKENNSVENLVCMLPTEHRKMHNHKRRLRKQKTG